MPTALEEQRTQRLEHISAAIMTEFAWIIATQFAGTNQPEEFFEVFNRKFFHGYQTTPRLRLDPLEVQQGFTDCNGSAILFAVWAALNGKSNSEIHFYQQRDRKSDGRHNENKLERNRHALVRLTERQATDNEVPLFLFAHLWGDNWDHMSTVLKFCRVDDNKLLDQTASVNLFNHFPKNDQTPALPTFIAHRVSALGLRRRTVDSLLAHHASLKEFLGKNQQITKYENLMDSLRTRAWQHRRAQT